MIRNCFKYFISASILLRHFADAILLHEFPQFLAVPDEHDLLEFPGADLLEARHLLAGADAAAQDWAVGFGVVAWYVVGICPVFSAE
jgi:hypothetical protein